MNTYSRVTTEEDRDALQALENYAGLQLDLGDFPKAVSMLRRALEIHLRISGEESEGTMDCMHSLAVSLSFQNNFL